jgi:holo-[acyl-carrier protein] synthase
MSLSHGIDMVDCRRLRELIDRYGERFLHRIFSRRELEYCLGKKREIEHLSGRFAAKEAVLKLLGTGLRRGMSWTEIEILNEQSGQPRVHLSGRCRQIADERNLEEIVVSISHIETHAIASAVASARQFGALGNPR